MDVLKTILSFLTTLAQIIFPRRKRPAAGDCPCPNPLPAPAGPPVSLDTGDGGDTELHRGDSVALERDFTDNNNALSNLTYVAGCGLMMAGGVGCVLRHLL